MTPTEARSMNAWGSHLPALLFCVAKAADKVLELGVGHFSTPQLHMLCAAEKLNLVSVDDNQDWINEFKQRLLSSGHDFICSPYTEWIRGLSGDRWGVAFIDHSDSSENRREHFNLLREVADYVIVHDFHGDNRRQIEPLLQIGNYHVCECYQPPTLVYSNIFDIPDELMKL